MDLLAERCSTDATIHEAIVALSSDNLPGSANVLREGLIVTLLSTGKQSALAELLSQRCPRYILVTDIELSIVLNRQSPKELLILCDAYSLSTKPEVKREIAAALRRALGPLRLETADDDLMIEMTRQWYRHDRKLYDVDTSYLGGDNFMTKDGKLANYRRALFMPRASSRPTKGK